MCVGTRGHQKMGRAGKAHLGVFLLKGELERQGAGLAGGLLGPRGKRASDILVTQLGQLARVQCQVLRERHIWEVFNQVLKPYCLMRNPLESRPPHCRWHRHFGKRALGTQSPQRPEHTSS